MGRLCEAFAIEMYLHGTVAADRAWNSQGQKRSAALRTARPREAIVVGANSASRLRTTLPQPRAGSKYVDVFQALVLGIVQGLTEFLPISSSGHLRIVPALLGWEDPGAAFTAVIQIGTLAAVLAYFRQDIVRIGRAWTRSLAGGGPRGDLDARMGWMMIVGTVPIVVCGLAFKDQIETSLRSLYVVAAAMIGLALLLAAAEVWVRARQRRGIAEKQLDQITWGDAVFTGLAQALALVPGSSRSGVTITAGLFAGMSRETAARFSFLLSLPSVFAAGAYQLYKARGELLGHRAGRRRACCRNRRLAGRRLSLDRVPAEPYLKTHTTYVFVAYRLLLGGLIFYWLSVGVLSS